MKKIYLILFIISINLTLPNTSDGQSILNRVKSKVKQRADNKVDNSIDKGLDEVEGKNKTKAKTEEGQVKEKTKTDGVEKSESESNAQTGTKLSYTSKYDFVQGDKVIAYEDFNSANLGDFPVRWNTNASAEVVTIDNKEGKWLKIGEKGIFHPEFITNLPENFTLEFDLGVNNANYLSPLCVNIASLKKP